MVPKTHHMSASYSSGYDTQYPRCDDKSELAAPVGTGSASLECGKLPGGLSGSVFRLGDIVTCADQVDALDALQREIIQCERCPRLLEHCRSIAATKRHAYRHWDYWAGLYPRSGTRGPAAARRLGPWRAWCESHWTGFHGRWFRRLPVRRAARDWIRFPANVDIPGRRPCDIDGTATSRRPSAARRPQNKPATREEFAACRSYPGTRDWALLCDGSVRLSASWEGWPWTSYLGLLQSATADARIRKPGTGLSSTVSMLPIASRRRAGAAVQLPSQPARTPGPAGSRDPMLIAVLELAKETISWTPD